MAGRPSGARAEICPACRRIAAVYPAGELTIVGTFAQTHRDEVLNLIHNTETSEKAEHPRHRIMRTSDAPDTITVTTTDLHLPRRIGEALHHAYQAASRSTTKPTGISIAATGLATPKAARELGSFRNSKK